jgi:hypothetical protein
MNWECDAFWSITSTRGRIWPFLTFPDLSKYIRYTSTDIYWIGAGGSEAEVLPSNVSHAAISVDISSRISWKFNCELPTCQVCCWFRARTIFGRIRIRFFRSVPNLDPDIRPIESGIFSGGHFCRTLISRSDLINKPKGLNDGFVLFL